MSFLQSPEWEEFQHSLRRKTWRVDGQLVIGHKLPFGFNYLYSPRPRIEDADSFFAKAQAIAKKERAFFLKIDPSDNFQFSVFNFQSNFNFQFSNPLQPQNTVILDLSKSEDELLAAMHEKTRYNIRLAERRGVKIENYKLQITNYKQISNPKFQKFWELLQETSGRNGFHTHEREYYQKLLIVKSDTFSNELFFAEYKGKVLAAAMVNFYNGIVTYLHGASGREYKEVMAPYLLHWEIIKEAKRRGFAQYDFWGIDEKRWPGVTRFKKGFGGNIIEYPDSFGAVYNILSYRIYRAVKKYLFRNAHFY